MDTKTQATVSALAAQRNQAMDAVAELNGMLAERDATIAELQKQLEPKE